MSRYRAVSSVGILVIFNRFTGMRDYVDPLDFSQLAGNYRALLNQYGFQSTEVHLTG